jgi:hypothetical protein
VKAKRPFVGNDKQPTFESKVGKGAWQFGKRARTGKQGDLAAAGP